MDYNALYVTQLVNNVQIIQSKDAQNAILASILCKIQHVKLVKNNTMILTLQSVPTQHIAMWIIAKNVI